MPRRVHQSPRPDDGLFEALPDPIFVTSPTGDVLSRNDAAHALLPERHTTTEPYSPEPYSPEPHSPEPYSIEGVNIADLFPFVTPGAWAPDTFPVWQGQITDRHGEQRDVEIVGRTISGSSASERCVYVIHDVSRYLEMSRSREVLLHGAAHELRNPVTALENVLDLLATDAATLSAVEFKRLLDLAARTAERLSELTEGLLNAATIRTGNLQISLEPCSLAILVDFALDSVGLMLDARSQTVKREGDIGLWVLADHRFGPRVLANLIANASKYSPRGATIRVAAQAQDAEVLVRVVDQGQGILPEQIERLFERYYRAKPANEEPGIGLGLAIAQGIVQAHGGRIGVESELGKGTTVWFTLRAAQAEDREGNDRAAHIPSA